MKIIIPGTANRRMKKIAILKSKSPIIIGNNNSNNVGQEVIRNLEKLTL